MKKGDQMTYQSLYRKYRPKHLDEVVGQEHILQVLRNSLKKDMISHAYLFCGPRGTGKTSIAKLMAQSINCETPGEVACGKCKSCIEGANHPDIVEIDAASNNGVEEIRNLIDRVKYTPILGKYKVYIIDEVHMLSQGAFNAFLKTLEEPPEHAVFILATTEIHKVLPTIISRCQRFDFTNIKQDAITQRLEYILTKESVVSEEGVCELIASLSSGALRNALTILEQAIIVSSDKIKIEEVYDTNGVVTSDQKIELFKSIENSDISSLNNHINKLNNNVINVERLTMDLVTGIKDSIIYSYTNNESGVPYFDLEFIKYLDESMTVEKRLSYVDILLSYVEKMKFSQNQEVYLELALMNMTNANENSHNQHHSVDVPRETLNFETSSNVSRETIAPKPEDESATKAPSISDFIANSMDINTTSNLDFNSPSIEDSVEDEPFISEAPSTEDESFVIETENEIGSQPDYSVDNIVNDNSLDESKSIEISGTSDNSSAEIKLPTETEMVEDNESTNTQLDALSLDMDEPISSSNSELIISTDNIVRFMVSADKEARIVDENHFKDISNYRTDINWARSARLMSNAKVVLSSEQFIVLGMDSPLQSKEIMEAGNKVDILNFIEKLLGKRKQVFSITNQDFQDSVKIFVDMNKSGSLPTPFSKEDFVETNTQVIEEKKDESLSKILDLFGDNVTIV